MRFQLPSFQAMPWSLRGPVLVFSFPSRLAPSEDSSHPVLVPLAQLLLPMMALSKLALGVPFKRTQRETEKSPS